MTNIAKIKFADLWRKLGNLQASVVLVLLLSACLYSGYRIGNFYHSYQSQQISQQQQRLTQAYQQHEIVLKQLHQLQVELEVEKITNQHNAELLKQSEQQKFALKKQLAFYEKVMAPEKQADGLVLDKFSIEPTGSANHYRFNAVLVQQLQRKRYAKGYVQIAFVGSLDGKPSRIELPEIAKHIKTHPEFSFKYFQTLEGEFTLPVQYIPEKVEIAVILPKGKWQKYSRIDVSYGWTDLVTGLAEPL